jgi:hypothetical protein
MISGCMRALFPLAILEFIELPILLKALPGNTAVNHSPQLSAEVKNVQNFTYIVT